MHRQIGHLWVAKTPSAGDDGRFGTAAILELSRGVPFPLGAMPECGLGRKTEKEAIEARRS